MGEIMKELKNLLKIKSLFSITVMFLLVYGTITETLQSELVASVITAVITYYFTKTNEKE